MMEIWEKNIKVLANKNEKLASEMKRLIQRRTLGDVQIKTSENNEKILAVERGGYLWYLNSRIDPKSASDLYVDRYAIKPFYRYFIFGFSDGRIIRRLLEKCDETNAVIVCEPNKEIMASAIMQYDLEDLFLDDRIWICIFEMWEAMCQAVFGIIGYSHIKLLEFCILPGYDVLYTKECKKFMDEVNHKVSYEVAHKNTYINFNRKIPQNMLFHMKNMIEQRNSGQIKNALQEIGIEGLPAILVAAGPSLDKNIKEIKQAEGKAFIFVVDAALKTVIQEGIQPTLVCTVDPRAPERFFETVGEKEFLWSCCGWTNLNPIQRYGKKVFYYNPIVPWWSSAIQKELDYEYPKIESGGSVSAEAFELLWYFGFDTIILVGQDLAFTGGQSHTKGIQGVLGDNDDYIRQRQIVQVKDINGNMINTDFQMDYYRQWFEKMIEQRKGRLRVIDATEGGARIEGTIIMTLEEAIVQECKREIDIDKNLKSIPPALKKAQRVRLYKKIDELQELKTDFNVQAEKAIRLCQELSDNLPVLAEEEISNRLTDVLKQNEMIDEHPFMSWITMYAKEEEFDLQEDIFAKEDMEIEEMIERTIRLLKSYQAGIPLFEEDLKEIIGK